MVKNHMKIIDGDEQNNWEHFRDAEICEDEIEIINEEEIDEFEDDRNT